MLRSDDPPSFDQLLNRPDQGMSDTQMAHNIALWNAHLNHVFRSDQANG